LYEAFFVLTNYKHSSSMKL